MGKTFRNFDKPKKSGKNDDYKKESKTKMKNSLKNYSRYDD